MLRQGKPHIELPSILVMAEAADKIIIEQAQKRFTLCQDAEHDLRRDALDDLQVLSGDQWPPEIKQRRVADKRPCLTINRQPQFVRQVTNAQRQNRIAAMVRPVDDKADIETAEVIQGIIRHIERQSHAEDAYLTAGFYAAADGLGYFRVVTEYCDPTSFDQDIRIKRIRNPFSVYFDPTSIEPDGSDGDFAFITEQLTKEEFKAQHPDADMASLDDYMAVGDGPKDWVTDSEVRIVEYFYREKKKDTLLLVRGPDGATESLLKSSLPEEGLPEGFEILKERDVEIPTIKWCKLNAVEVLDRTELPGRWIPVIKVIGSELEIDGKLQLSGVVRFTKDAQRQYNFMASAETEAIALEPKAPVVGVEGQFANHEEEWKQSNVRNFAYLEYAQVNLGGQPAPPPSRLSANPNIQSMVMARAQAADDMKATAGIYDAQLGARANETSGKAILARTQQGEISNYHYADNLKRSVEHCCRILTAWIPVIYDTPRTVRIIGESDEEKVVRVNERFLEGGEEKGYFLNAGRYDVVTTAGPSYTSRRAQAAEQMIALASQYPALMQVAGDLIAKNLDIPGAQELSERLKKTLPPQLQDAPEGQPPIPPQAQMKIEQLGQLAEQLTQALNQANETIQTKKLELDSRERIEMAKIQAQMAQTTMELDSKEAIEFLKVEVENIKEQLGMNVEKEATEASATAQRI